MASCMDLAAGSSQCELAEEGASLYTILIDLCENNASYFESDQSEHGQKLHQSLLEMLRCLRLVSPKIEEIRGVAPNFDFDEKTPYNGYRSFVTSMDLCVTYCIKVSRQILTNRSSYFFRKAHYVKELDNCAQMLDSLNHIADLNLKLLSWTTKNALFAMDKCRCFEEIYVKITDINLYCFYGRCIGFQFKESIHHVMKTLAIMLASFSEVYYCDGGSMLARATNSVWHSSKYLLDPELRAKRIVRCTIWASVDFCKAFWFLGEIELMNKVPNLVYSSVAVNRLIKLEPEPLQIIGMNGDPIDIPVPATALGQQPLNVRLISKNVYEGMKEDAAGSPSKTAPVPKSSELIFHCHGGGFVAQSSRSHESYLREWAIYLDCPIVSVDYSLAPEAPFPRGLEDVLYAYCWALNNCAQLGSTAERVVVAGDSAGANLSLSLGFKCIELGIRPPDGIFIAYAPVLISFLPSPSRLLALLDPILPIGFLSACLRAYADPNSANEMCKYEHKLKRVSTVKITDPNVPIVSSPTENPETVIMDAKSAKRKCPSSIKTESLEDLDDKDILAKEKVIKTEPMEDTSDDETFSTKENTTKTKPMGNAKTEPMDLGSESNNTSVLTKDRIKTEPMDISDEPNFTKENIKLEPMDLSESDDKSILAKEKVISTVVPESRASEKSLKKYSPEVETIVAPVSMKSSSSSNSVLINTIQQVTTGREIKTKDGRASSLSPTEDIPVESKASVEDFTETEEACPKSLKLSKNIACKLHIADDAECAEGALEEEGETDPQCLRKKSKSALDDSKKEKLPKTCPCQCSVKHLQQKSDPSDEGNSKLRPEFSKAVESVTTAITNVFINLTKSNNQTAKIDQGIEALDEEEISVPLEYFTVKTPEDYFLSPILAPDEILKSLPPVRVLTTEMDPFLDDCVSFSKKLKDLDHNVGFDVLPGLPHGFLTFSLINKEANEGSELCCQRIRELLDLPAEEGTDAASASVKPEPSQTNEKKVTQNGEVHPTSPSKPAAPPKPSYPGCFKSSDQDKPSDKMAETAKPVDSGCSKHADQNKRKQKYAAPPKPVDSLKLDNDKKASQKCLEPTKSVDSKCSKHMDQNKCQKKYAAPAKLVNADCLELKNEKEVSQKCAIPTKSVDSKCFKSPEQNKCQQKCAEPAKPVGAKCSKLENENQASHKSVRPRNLSSRRSDQNKCPQKYAAPPRPVDVECSKLEKENQASQKCSVPTKPIDSKYSDESKCQQKYTAPVRPVDADCSKLENDNQGSQKYVAPTKSIDSKCSRNSHQNKCHQKYTAPARPVDAECLKLENEKRASQKCVKPTKSVDSKCADENKYQQKYTAPTRPVDADCLKLENDKKDSKKCVAPTKSVDSKCSRNADQTKSQKKYASPVDSELSQTGNQNKLSPKSLATPKPADSMCLKPVDQNKLTHQWKTSKPTRHSGSICSYDDTCSLSYSIQSVSTRSTCLTIGQIAEKNGTCIKEEPKKKTKLCIYRSANSLSDKSKVLVARDENIPENAIATLAGKRLILDTGSSKSCSTNNSSRLSSAKGIEVLHMNKQLKDGWKKSNRQADSESKAESCTTVDSKSNSCISKSS